MRFGRRALAGIATITTFDPVTQRKKYHAKPNQFVRRTLKMADARTEIQIARLGFY